MKHLLQNRLPLLITLLIISGATALLFLPNPFFSRPCTTVSYGLPFPVKTVHCLCEKGRISYSFWGALADASIASAVAVSLYRRLKRNRKKAL